MPLSEKVTSGEYQASLVGDIEGDITRFSNLDFARLGLATDTNHTLDITQYRNVPADNLRLTGRLRYDQNVAPGSLDGDLCSLTLPNDMEATTSSADAFSSFDSDLIRDSWLQTSALPSEYNSTHMHEFRTSRISDVEGVKERAPVGDAIEAYQFRPVLGHQQPGLPRRRSQYFRSRHQHNTPQVPIDIPSSSHTNDKMGPMERWRESPPEMEPASLSDIATALRHTRLRASTSGDSLRGPNYPGSVSSFGSGSSFSSRSNASVSSANFKSAGSRARGRVTKRWRATPKRTKHSKEKRSFPCTFCCDSFKSKYDWARHEKSLHLNLQGWRCTPFGGSIISPDTGRAHCAYCNMLDPSTAHLDLHNDKSCEVDGQTPIFSRKDHLVQHLRHVHHTDTLPIIDNWKFEGPPISSRCGFCSIMMNTWQERVDHLAKHFREGATMDDWKGDHCFESSIAVKVRHAMPPYLIGPESRALIPFSVNSHGTKDHLSQIQQASEHSMGMWDQHRKPESEPSPESIGRQNSPSALNKDTSSMTFPEVLALHLGHYAQEKMRNGIIPTDKMFQDEARRIMFDSVDPWDQTIADNSDWLSCFRHQHVNDLSESRKHHD